MKKKFWLDFSWVVFFILFFIFLKLCVIGFYLIPSPSMLPAFVPGDRVIANKLAYGLTLPFFQTPLFQWSTPQRGDVILFSFPHESEIYIKRVIGLPGDFITFNEGIISINREPLVLKNMIQQKENELELNLFEEGQPHFKKSHLVYMSKEPAQTFFESHRFLVPPGKLLVLGDNRDNSADSRVHGYVNLKDVYGRASFVLFSTQGDSFFPNFRKGRTFITIE
ncbi:MAG: signal peptidase I [Bdellovibrionota bacterium]